MVGSRLAWELFLEFELPKLLNLNSIRLLQPKLLIAKYCQRPTYTQSILDTGLASPDCRLAAGASDGMVCDANAHEFIVRFPRGG